MADVSFEANGGSDSSFVDASDLQQENCELSLQNRKLLSEITKLKQQLSSAEETNMGLMSQKEKVEARLEQSRLNADKVREQLGREVDDIKSQLNSAEDKCIILSNRIARLERDNSDLIRCNDKLRQEAATVNADSRICQMQLKELSEEMKSQELLSRQQIQNLIMRNQEADKEIRSLHETVSDLRSNNTVVSRQKLELENLLFMTKSRSHVCDLRSNGDAHSAGDGSDEESHFNSPLLISPGPGYQNNSLHAELTASLGYPQEVSLPMILQGLPEVNVGIQCDLGAIHLDEEPSIVTANAGTQCDMENGSILLIFDQPKDENQAGSPINLTTVSEEAEQEVEPYKRNIAGNMNMNIEKSPRKRLVRMTNAVEEDVKTDLDDYESTDNFSGILSSSARNKEHPLQEFNHSSHSNNNGRMDDDICSTISSENTVYDSATSLSSSSTYWSNTEGSSLRDSSAVHKDGEPNLLKILHEETDSKSKQKASIWGVTMAIDNRLGTPAIGVIPEAEQEHMKRYAFDTVARSCEPDAEILSRSEWRTLKKDLNAKEHAQYKKHFGQDGGGSDDADGNMKSTVNADLEDEAEEYCENYSQLVEQLFQSLDDFKRTGNELDETDLALISQRFEQLALVFKTDHMNLPARSEVTSKSYETAVGRMKDISNSLRQCLRKLRDHKLPGEIHDDLSSIENVSEELEMYSTMLSKAARRVGRIDLENRLCKMIEVMVLYVHILKTLHRNIDEDFSKARTLLEENDIPLPSKKSVGKLQHTINNNVEDKVSWDPPETVGSHSELVERYLPEWYEVIRRELCWPWSWDQTWVGIKQGFAGFIMVVGLLVVAGSVVPNVAANEYDSVLLRVCSILARHGLMTHNEVPRL